MHIIDVDFDPEFKTIILKSDYFKLWTIDQLPYWENI